MNKHFNKYIISQNKYKKFPQKTEFNSYSQNNYKKIISQNRAVLSFKDTRHTFQVSPILVDQDDQIR